MEGPVSAVVPAAGRAERFGGPKLLADVGGVPMLQRTLWSLLDAGMTEVIVVLAPDSPVAVGGAQSIRSFADEDVRTVVNPDPARGMLSSIQTGLAVAIGDPILVLPGDMPFVRPETVAVVASVARERGVPVSPRFEGRRGHPLALPASLRAAILAADPSSTLSDVLAGAGAVRFELDVDDPGIHRDVDTREDL